MKTYVGIDPGKSGAVVSLSPGGVPLISSTPTLGTTTTKREYDLRSMVEMLETIQRLGDAVVVIERTGVRPGEGVVSAHSIGYGGGLWIGMLSVLRIPYFQVAPQTWRAVLMKGMPKADGTKARKEQAAHIAGQLFPGINLRGPKGGLRDGWADALLIAEYGRRISA
jgi:hypothetical protein